MAKMWWNSLIVNPVVLGSWAVCAAPNALAQIEGYTPIRSRDVACYVSTLLRIGCNGLSPRGKTFIIRE
jgi:hypothetical protein